MEIVKYSYLSLERLNEIMNNIDDQRIGIIGDGTLDIYWQVDMRKSKLSRETPHYPLPVVSERIDLGAGANVASNLAAFSRGQVDLLTVISKDWRGREFKKIFKNKKISTDFIIETNERATSAYCKPLMHGHSEVVYEAPRLDFINSKDISGQLETEIIEKIEVMIEKTDMLIITDQLEYGIINSTIRGKINTLAKEEQIIVDSRQNIGKFNGVITKPNEMEAINATAIDDSWEKAGKALSKNTGSPVLMTLGEEGCCWFDGEKESIRVPAVKTEGDIDIVGAGDAFLAAFTIAYSGGADIKEAMIIGNLAASIVIKKLSETGTFSKGEIIRTFTEIMEDRKYGDS
ncbi:MAG: bifunctional heptose 7-phosphate kinase/heptose 1-phosphate adenyltransferase [Halanaerobiales bacterium]